MPYVKKRHLGIDAAEASLPPCELMPEDWDDMSKWQRATATNFWTARRHCLRNQIAEAVEAISSLSFSDSFKYSGTGPVYAVRAVPTHSPSGKMRNQFYKIDPADLSRIIGDDTYSGISGYFEPDDAPNIPPDLRDHVPSEAAQHTGHLPIS